MPPLRRGAAVVDLGCAPGAWLQVLVERVGPGGSVVGVDLEPVAELEGPVVLLSLDVTDPATPAAIAEALGRPADAVFSDAAPKLTGISDVDRAAGEELCTAALRIADEVLAPNGSLVVKSFPGPESDRFRDRLRKCFERVSELRPEGRRSSSKEFYWLACPEQARGRGRRRRTRRGNRA